ncbi:BQ2448_3294 [Microbotryum intermedium]|uniref:BQ2448_3294 protein n=1 Tax=Microbotryum intermedium TaxID=269621 RepID=A0A238FKW3_9BASI|nr:BQ2448_3294 [Microbotryum intermedium]
MSLPMTQPGIAVVTGASSGIGRACSIALAHAGWTVVMSGRRENELEETYRRAKEAKPGIKEMTWVAGDLSRREDVVALFDFVREKYDGVLICFYALRYIIVAFLSNATFSASLLPPTSADVLRLPPIRVITNIFATIESALLQGRLDLLFNNAGRSTAGCQLQDTPFEDWESILAINVTAPFLCTQEAFKIMSTQSPKGGRIVNNGSISSYTPRPFSAPYTMTKHAVAGLTKSTALDGREHDIACSQIDIGNAESKMASKDNAGKLQPFGEVRDEPVIPVEYVGATLVYMASLPLDVNILNQTLMATKMPFVGRG